jgi:hypothetical protein
MAAFLPGSSGAFDPHLPNTIMAQGEDIGEPPFMAATMHPPTLFKRTRASYPSAGEELTMKLGLSIGCSGAHWMCQSPWCSARRNGVTTRLVGQSLWLRRDHAARVPRRQPTASSFGAGIVQLAARTPANAAMSAACIDAMSGVRFIAGIGASGPQIVEG